MTERITLDAGDAAELIDLFEFCCDWFDHDRSRLDDSLWRFTGGGVGVGQLRDDLRRLAVKLSRAPFTARGGSNRPHPDTTPTPLRASTGLTEAGFRGRPRGQGR